LKTNYQGIVEDATLTSYQAPVFLLEPVLEEESEIVLDYLLILIRKNHTHTNPLDEPSCWGDR
jgi:hypothetical protein